LRSAFEGTNGLAAAHAEARIELQTLAALDQATVATAAEPSLVEWVGLLGAEPQAQLAVARQAFESGQVASAGEHATAVSAARQEAAGLGRERIAFGGGGLLLLDALAMGGLAARRRRRRRATTDPAPTASPVDSPL
jgi:hypothetical protein